MQEVTLVLATQNKNKIREISALLQDYPVRIMNLDDFGPKPAPVEDADTFEGNAFLKASHYACILGRPTLADDSGLMIEALGGAPGVHSARWAGEKATDAGKCALILEQMEGQTKRRASFVCALVLAVPAGPALTWTGRIDGELTTEPHGFNGFGYDPIFFYPPLKKTLAELSPAEKGRVSHRGRALAEFKSEFDKVLIWLDERLKEAGSPC
ncbi:MAG: XTP/dITP diphosphatase [Deltaproteobacteria bacterium]|nr:XTP/dITP diphosphatase [Deltaproteobacteria bacterium]MBW2085244.1 XTP/dITP diphosphatase [Deltaproteobacteria bacterium]